MLISADCYFLMNFRTKYSTVKSEIKQNSKKIKKGTLCLQSLRDNTRVFFLNKNIKRSKDFK